MPGASALRVSLAIAAALLGAPAAAHAEDLVLGAGAYTIDTGALTITGPGVSATGFDDGGIAAFPFENITIPSSATVTIVGSRTLSLRASDTLTAHAVFDVSGGHASGPSGGVPGAGGGVGGDAQTESNPGAGPAGGGAPTNAFSGGGGGGHASDGGAGASAILQGGSLVASPGFGGAGGVINVTDTGPLWGGSGGGSGSPGAGGGGGAGSVELVGRILAGQPELVAVGGDGAASPDNVTGGGGGGSSGMLRVIAETVTGDLSMTTRSGNGGDGGAGGGEGGGGAMVFLVDSFPGGLVISGGGSGPGVGVVNGGSAGEGFFVGLGDFATVAERLDELEGAVRQLDLLDGLLVFESERDETEQLCAEITDLIFELDALGPALTEQAPIELVRSILSLVIELRTRLACGPLPAPSGGGGGDEDPPSTQPAAAPTRSGQPATTTVRQIFAEHVVNTDVIAPAPAATPVRGAAVTAPSVRAAIKKAKAKKRARAKKRKRARARTGKRARARSVRPRARRAG